MYVGTQAITVMRGVGREGCLGGRNWLHTPQTHLMYTRSHTPQPTLTHTC